MNIVSVYIFFLKMFDTIIIIICDIDNISRTKMQQLLSKNCILWKSKSTICRDI